MLVSIVIGMISVTVERAHAVVVADFVGALLSYALLRYASKSGRYQQCYLITILAVFLVLFPFLFFRNAAYLGGIPSFFVFAVVFTVFMLEGKLALGISALELVVYIALSVFACNHPEYVQFYELQSEYMLNPVMDFVIVSIALGVTMFYHFRLYNEQQALLAEQNRVLERLNQMKTKFLANVSHKLKTPLTVVSGYAQTSGQSLADKSDASEDIRRMRLIASEADRMALMVSQLLDVTRIEEGRMVWNKKPAAMAEIVERTLATYYPAMSKSNNKLRFRRLGDLPPVLVDESRIRQVIVNLISNAVRYTGDGEITVAMDRIPGFVEIYVSDTGDGIAPEQMPNLFQRFSKKHAPRRTLVRILDYSSVSTLWRGMAARSPLKVSLVLAPPSGLQCRFKHLPGQNIPPLRGDRNLNGAALVQIKLFQRIEIRVLLWRCHPIFPDTAPLLKTLAPRWRRERPAAGSPFG